jgi:hypothetical protein
VSLANAPVTASSAQKTKQSAIFFTDPPLELFQIGSGGPCCPDSCALNDAFYSPFFIVPSMCKQRMQTYTPKYAAQLFAVTGKCDVTS